MPKASSSHKALAAILPLIASNQPYEAHQKARTFASRYTKAGQHDTAIDVLFQSARELFKVSQLGSGTDLTIFVIEVYESVGVPVGEESRGRITQLLALVGPEGSWRKSIIDKSIHWSMTCGVHPAGDPELLYYIGELLYKDGEFEQAEPHFLASGNRDSARLLAEMMVQWCGSKHSPGPFALHGTIPYLQNGNILAAHTFVTHFTSRIITTRPDVSTTRGSLPISDTWVHATADPLLNFAQLVVFTCQRAQGGAEREPREAWVRLCATYQAHGIGGDLLRHPEVHKTLHELGTLYFNISPPTSQAANPMAEILSSLLGVGAPPTGTRRALTPVRGAELD